MIVMFNLFNKKTKEGARVIFKIGGMHCTSCSMNIDDELEDTEGVIKAETSYAKAKTVVTYDPMQVTPKKLKEVIKSLEYTVAEID